MADTPLHPATARLAGYPAWTADPVIPVLFAALRDLDAIGARIEALRRDRPDLGLDDVRGEIGAVAALVERRPDRDYAYGCGVRANGGACAGLWELIACRRRAWVEARLAAEGFIAASASRTHAVHAAALLGAATPVALVWVAFRAADRSAPAAANPRLP